MHHEDIQGWQHDHTFGQNKQRPAERRTHVVIVPTAVIVVVEVIGGIAFGSMSPSEPPNDPLIP